MKLERDKVYVDGNGCKWQIIYLVKSKDLALGVSSSDDQHVRWFSKDGQYGEPLGPYHLVSIAPREWTLVENTDGTFSVLGHMGDKERGKIHRDQLIRVKEVTFGG